MEATLTSKNQLTLPAGVRQVIGVKKGDTVAFLVEGRSVMVVPRNTDPLAALDALREGQWFPELRKEFLDERRKERREP